MIPTPRPQAHGLATSVDGTDIAWYRHGRGDQAILFVPTWNLVDARVVGHQVAALEQHATVITYDPRGAGASGRPERGYDFSLHAADALAVLDANGIGQASLVTASRGLNAAVLLVTDDPHRFDRVVAIGPYMRLESAPAPPDPEPLEAWRTDWPGFIVPFMHAVFTEPDSAERGSAQQSHHQTALRLLATPWTRRNRAPSTACPLPTPTSAEASRIMVM